MTVHDFMSRHEAAKKCTITDFIDFFFEKSGLSLSKKVR
jgi:hypothetical protein